MSCKWWLPAEVSVAGWTIASVPYHEEWQSLYRQEIWVENNLNIIFMWCLTSCWSVSCWLDKCKCAIPWGMAVAVSTGDMGGVELKHGTTTATALVYTWLMLVYTWIDPTTVSAQEWRWLSISHGQLPSFCTSHLHAAFKGSIPLLPQRVLSLIACSNEGQNLYLTKQGCC